VAPIAPPSLAQASRYGRSLHWCYSDTLPARLNTHTKNEHLLL
jgi:hypothetical protein